MCRRSTRISVHHLDFQYNNFLYIFFIVKKWPFYVNFSIPPCGKWIFLNVPHLLWLWDFGDMYLTHLETRIWRSTFHIYLKKWFFWPSGHFRAMGGVIGLRNNMHEYAAIFLKMSYRNDDVKFFFSWSIFFYSNILTCRLLFQLSKAWKKALVKLYTDHCIYNLNIFSKI
jgi:hypothetical protein